MATVLLVDDDKDVLDTLVLTLKRGGYAVVAAESGTRALDLLAGGVAVDLMLTDVVMPDINGFNLARIVRMRHPRMRILFLTGFAEHAQTLRDPLEDYGKLLMKPIEPNRLRAEIAEALASAPPGAAPRAGG